MRFSESKKSYHTIHPTPKDGSVPYYSPIIHHDVVDTMSGKAAAS